MARNPVLKVTVLQDSKGDFKKTERSLDELAGTAVRVSAAMAVALGAGAYKAVNAASDLNEAINAVGVVFGDAADTINAFGEQAAETVGLSQREFSQLATNTGSLLQNLGYSAEGAADSTIALAERAADMASVFNTDVGTALEAINAGFRGQGDQLLQYGVKLDDASLKAKAMEMGLYDGTGALDASTKALAAEAVILEQTSALQGDFANTSDTMAGRQRTLKAEFENITAELGQALIPIVETLLGHLSDMVDWISENTETVELLIASVAGLAAGILAINAIVKTARAVMLAYNAVMAVARTIQLIYSGVMLIVAAANWAALGPILLIILAIAAVIAIIVLAVKNWDKILDVMKKVVTWVKNTAIAAWDGFTAAIQKVVDVLKKVWDWIKKILNSGIDAISNLWPFSTGSVSASVVSAAAVRGTAGGGGGFTVNFYGTVTDSESVARELRRVFERSSVRSANRVDVARAW